MGRSALEIQIWGIHPVLESLASSLARVHEIFLAASASSDDTEALSAARAKGVPIRSVSREELTRKLGTDKHQNLAARASLDVWDTVKDWWDETPRAAITALVVDGVQDPQNLGSLIRSAHFFGVDLFVSTRDRSASLTGVVAKASAGGLFSLPIVRAVNLARELEEMGERGVFRVALDPQGDRTLRDLDLEIGSLALVVGGEGQGIRALTAKRCDVVARLTDGRGRDSLNAAIAGAVGLYEVGLKRAKK